MVDEAYAKQRIDFVSDNAGTTWWEVEKLVAVGPTCILLRNIALPWLFPVKNFRVSCTRDKLAFMIVSICICILAVDFKLFPRRLAKTESFGFSLMDVGVGIIIFMTGVVSHAARGVTESLRFESRSIVPLLVMGASRQAMVSLLNYPVHQTEYGAHWNFFYTLAVVKAYLLTEPSSRNSDLFSLNREGIVSIIGYLSLYLIGVYSGGIAFTIR
ncbi:unnamed protein product [Soboliphyme baturini]|uniref:GPI ethanolamine phosphate transferase 1 n=1 Tax=Soboliphyme baturini TaxID=241478 RepID=A0A183IXW3_9BILA|nr:unnamed protein product [Soboliphyme baturini]